MTISIIIPIYNRPDELDELLASLAGGCALPDEVVVVEDGSTVPSDGVVAKWSDKLNIKYITQSNGGPAAARNAGAKVAAGEFLVILDSDTIVPDHYIAAIRQHEGVQFWGGADSASADFSVLQRAISYSMTSLFTTGGIRGKKGFTPRSFNMGITKELFEQIGGFSQDMRYGEDVDLSLRIKAAGVEPQFLPEATIYHKRRNTLGSFFRQVFCFGAARIELNRRHRESRKLVFWLPALFTLGSAALIITALFGLIIGAFWTWLTLSPLALVILIWFTDATIKNRSLIVGTVAIVTSFIQLCGYGLGFLQAASRARILAVRSK